LPDNRPLLLEGLKSQLGVVDALVLTGGVSAGVLDLVPGVLEELGVQTLFHRVAQRPGKPFWCGRLPANALGRATLVFGLPGNPVSSLFAFRRYVLPWLLAFEGRPAGPRRVEVHGLRARDDDQTVFLPWSEETGVMEWKGSGDYLALAGSTGFVEIDRDPRSGVEPWMYCWGGRE